MCSKEYIIQRKKYNVPEQRIIGKRSENNPDRMLPNETFVKYFGGQEMPEQKAGQTRSSCLRILPEILEKYLGKKETGLFLDLAAYSLISENNAAQYYPSYAYSHPLFTKQMHIYSDSKVSDFLAGLTDDQRIGFVNGWNENRDHREKIYISYDSTNKNCQAGDMRFVESGHPKDDRGLPVFNYSIAYDTYNKEPLFYEQYPGSIVDISQLQYMLKKAEGYGYKKVGFILDRGYFGRENIQYMDECGYDFVIMVKGMSESVRRVILENKGEFENIRKYNIRKYKTFGKTIKKKLYISDEKERYFHIYYSDQKACVEHEQIEAKIDRMTKYLNSLKGEKATVGDGYKKYFKLEIHEDDGTIICARERIEVIDLCGYFVIVTPKQMTAEEALELYKSRDVSEKMFRGDKSYLGNRSLRVQSDETASAKIFVEFVALIVRSRMYVLLKDEVKKLDKKPNYMTVPAAIRELEKIELVRQTDGKYCMDHAVTATQKIILKAFDMDADQIQDKAVGLSRLLEKYAEEGK